MSDSGEHLLGDGIPTERDYHALIRSDAYRAMEQYSDQFLATSSGALGDYRRRWVSDPLHQWSRQWEYPYVYSVLQQLAQRKVSPRILDAGSGVTFFPWFLGDRLPGATVSCCDYDASLQAIFERINTSQGRSTGFTVADLRALPHADGSQDAVYCISVLEHTDAYPQIIDEFHRVLAPGGTLVVTFDISLDGLRDIDVARAQELLVALSRRFECDSGMAAALPAALAEPGIFTTLTANAIDRRLLPWRAPRILYQLKSWLSKGRFGSWPPPLTVYCVCLTKPRPG